MPFFSLWSGDFVQVRRRRRRRLKRRFAAKRSLFEKGEERAVQGPRTEDIREMRQGDSAPNTTTYIRERFPRT